MFFLYDLVVLLSWFFLHPAALFNLKIRKFVTGRKQVFSYLKKHRDWGKPLIWIHTASLGEFEQGAPVLDRLKREYPKHQFLVTFFSPSGYEVKKNRLSPDLVTYLPMDTRWNARKANAKGTSHGFAKTATLAISSAATCAKRCC